MAVSTQTMHFREEKAAQLVQMANLLETYVGGNLNTGPIHKAAGQLRDENKIPLLKGGIVNPDVWGYDIEDFEIPLETLKHVKPSTITKGSVFLNLKIRANVNAWDDMNDPFLELNFKVDVKGVGEKVYHFGFHIDRHDLTATSAEPHPVYHIQYNINPTNSAEFDYGSIMYIDTPRLLHFPLDFILGVGFLTSNFFPTAFSILAEERGFVKLNNHYQEKIWKPYYHTLANHWKPFHQADVTWNPTSDICPILL
jgi:hypothetical protein